MTSKLTALPVDWQKEICSYLPTRPLLRFASTCKAMQIVVAEDEKSWRVRGAALRVQLDRSNGAAPALRQIQLERRFEARVLRAYQAGRAQGPALYHATASACSLVALLTLFVGAPLDDLYEIHAHYRRVNSILNEYADAMHYVTETTREQVINLAKSSLTTEEFRSWAQPLKDMHAVMLDTLSHDRDRRLQALTESRQARRDFADSVRNANTVALDVNNVALMVVAGPLCIMNAMDTQRRPHVESPRFNRSAALVGALAFGWGVVCLSHDLPVQGASLMGNGGLLFIRGATSYRYVTNLFGRAKGNFNVACLKTSVYAKRLLHAPRSEAVSSKLSALKHSIVTKVGQAADVFATLVGRVLYALPFGDCG